MLLEHVKEPAQKGFDMPFHGYMAFNRNNSEMDKAKLESSEWWAIRQLPHSCFLVFFWTPERGVGSLKAVLEYGKNQTVYEALDSMVQPLSKALLQIWNG